MTEEKTKLGKFLQTIGGGALDVVKNIASGKDPVSAILSAVTGGSISKEDGELAFKYHQEDLKDTQNARDNETARDTSENAGWLSKNIHELIAISVIGAWIFTWYIKSVLPTNEITGAVMLILGYLYGRTKPQS